MSPAALAVTGGGLALVRTFDKTAALTNSPILVTATLTNLSTDTFRGFYYFDEVPTSLTVATISVTLGGGSLTNFSFESGQDGDVYTGYTPRRWRLETPTNFTEASVIPPQGIVRVVFSISCASTGTFTLREFGCAACKPDKTNTLFGYSGTADQQTVSFVSSPPATNTAPMLPAQTNRTLLELTALTVTNTATDTNLPANVLTYALLNPPTGARVNTNGVITWTPAESQGPGTNLIATIVTDNETPPLSATNTFTVTVSEVNTAPTLPIQTNPILTGFQSLTVTNTATDNDLPANPLLYDFQGPAGASIDAAGVISWQPTVGQVPSTNLFITVVQDTNAWAVNARQLSATNSFTVIVNAIHNTPVLALAQTNWVVSELTQLRVTNTASDLNVPALVLSYLLLNPPAGASVNSNGIITWIPTEAQGPSTCVFATVVSDNGVPALSATNRFTVLVQEINTAPSLPAQTDRTIVGLVTLVATNTGTDGDLPANSLTYQLTSAPTGAVIDANGIITWTPNWVQVPSTNRFQTMVTDDNPWAINSPQLNAANTFVVVVLGSAAPFPISSIGFSNGVVFLSWAAIGGQTYRLQFEETLSDLIWHDVVPDIVAAGLPGGSTVATAQDVAGNASQRYYRIMLVR